MSDLIITSRLPDSADSERLLLARLLAGPVSGVGLTSAARTFSTITSDILTRGFRGIVAYLNVTAVPGAGGIRLKIIFKDPVSGQIKGLWQGSTNVTTTGLHVLVIYPGAGSVSQATASGTTNVVVGMPIPSTVQVQVEHTTADSYTYSLSWELLP